MLNQLLLPHRFKTIGWVILVPSVIVGVIASTITIEPTWLNANVFAIVSSDFFESTQWFHVVHGNLLTTIVGVLCIIGAMMVAFSKEKIEDEFIAKLRLSSLLWAVWVNYALLLLAFLFVYGMAFFTVMVYNMFIVLI